jgi:hypothetical protein
MLGDRKEIVRMTERITRFIGGKIMDRESGSIQKVHVPALAYDENGELLTFLYHKPNRAIRKEERRKIPAFLTKLQFKNSTVKKYAGTDIMYIEPADGAAVWGDGESSDEEEVVRHNNCISKHSSVEVSQPRESRRRSRVIESDSESEDDEDMATSIYAQKKKAGVDIERLEQSNELLTMEIIKSNHDNGDNEDTAWSGGNLETGNDETENLAGNRKTTGLQSMAVDDNVAGNNSEQSRSGGQTTASTSTVGVFTFTDNGRVRGPFCGYAGGKLSGDRLGVEAETMQTHGLFDRV